MEPLLPLKDLAARHYGLIESIAGTYEAAARVCLDRHHLPPKKISIRNNTSETTAVIAWEPADARTRGALNNQTDTTEAGAYGCVIAGIELTEGLYTVGRAETLTGADYYVGPAGRRLDDLEDCWRLEISGTDKGTITELESLLQKKCQQTKDGHSSLPALAGVIGFKILQMLVQYVDDK